MTWDQWKAILWLRWRLTVNQFHRSGVLSAVILSILLALAVMTGVSLFFVGLVAGAFLLPKATPEHTLFLWDAVCGAFIFFWLIGVVTELQRSEMISLDRLLHLPLTLAGTFVLNYASSFVSLAMILFLPGMVGLAIASVVAQGRRLLVIFPLLFGFVLLVTGVTYQFRGWLATLMVNKRRRRTIITLLTAGVVILCQAPQLFNIAFQRWRYDRPDENGSTAIIAYQTELNRALAAGEITIEEHTRRLQERIAENNVTERERTELVSGRIVRGLTLANAVLPPGWLAHGAMSATDGRVGLALLAALGSILLGAVSLRRAYHTTLRFYTGGFQAGGAMKPTPGPSAQPAAGDAAVASSRARNMLLEWKLPVVAEPCAVIALANFRSLTRAPEVKMMLLTPVFVLAMLGVSLMNARHGPMPEQFRPLVALAAISVTMFCLIGVIQNQFGLDRSAFRAYVLSGTPRRDILLGKNLAVAPYCVGLGVLVLGVTQALLPLRISALLSLLLLLVASFLVFCAVGNLSSILAPYAMAPGALKPANPKGLTILWSMLFAFLFPVISVVTVIPLAIDLLLQWLEWNVFVPVDLVLAVAELAVIAFAYRHLLAWQGGLLARRETRILELVTTKDE